MREHAKQEKRNTFIEQKVAREARLRSIRARELREKKRDANGEPLLKKIVRPSLIAEDIWITDSHLENRKCCGDLEYR